jgi:hypothetical protein
LSILRVGFLLVLIGFFAPICCDMSGYQLAQGILGNAHQAGKAIFLGSIEDFYGYLLFGVFILALLGLVLTFLGGVRDSPLIASVGLAVSCVLLIIVAVRLRTFRDTGVVNLALTIIPIKLKPLIGAYSMAVGYLAGLVGTVLRFMRR